MSTVGKACRPFQDLEEALLAINNQATHVRVENQEWLQILQRTQNFFGVVSKSKFDGLGDEFKEPTPDGLRDKFMAIIADWATLSKKQDLRELLGVEESASDTSTEPRANQDLEELLAEESASHTSSDTSTEYRPLYSSLNWKGNQFADYTEAIDLFDEVVKVPDHEIQCYLNGQLSYVFSKEKFECNDHYHERGASVGSAAESLSTKSFGGDVRLMVVFK